MFFFFQAEDGIRDTSVTGVQTCALPIYVALCMSADDARVPFPAIGRPALAFQKRSEERRVGKECRSRRAPDHKKKNIKSDDYLQRVAVRDEQAKKHFAARAVGSAQQCPH